MRRTLWVVAAIAASSSFASAADLRPAKKAAAAPVAVVTAYNWTGYYVGAHCGGAWGHTTSPEDDANNRRVSVNPSGWLCGAQLGYNFQSGAWLWGLEGDIGYLGLDKRVEYTADATTRFSEVGYNSWYGTLTGRLGYTWDRWLSYLKGGAAFAHIRNAAGETAGGDFTETSGTSTGWTIGGGIEYAYAPNWTAKVEYLYLDFGSKHSKNDDDAPLEHKNSVHTVKLGLNYKL